MGIKRTAQHQAMDIDAYSRNYRSKGGTNAAFNEGAKSSKERGGARNVSVMRSRQKPAKNKAAK